MAGDRDILARVWAKEWGCDSIYKQIPVGGKFRFRSCENGVYMVKERHGYRMFHRGSPLGPKKLYRTGARTAVCSLPDDFTGE
jgi:hypothetical protein